MAVKLGKNFIWYSNKGIYFYDVAIKNYFVTIWKNEFAISIRQQGFVYWVYKAMKIDRSIWVYSIRVELRMYSLLSSKREEDILIL